MEPEKAIKGYKAENVKLQNTIDDYAKNLRQNPHLNFDMAFVFQTETTRQTTEWIESLRADCSIRYIFTFIY